jgi:hypothetical protein
MSSPTLHDNAMATRTFNNCGHTNVKQQTVISNENGNKGHGFFAVTNHLSVLVAYSFIVQK